MLSDKNLISPGIKAQADLKLFKENREPREKPRLFNSRKQCRENNRMLSLRKKGTMRLVSSLGTARNI